MAWMCCLYSSAARQNMNKMFDKWSNTPSETLLDKAREAVHQGNRQEALLLYSTVANRYYQEDVSLSEQEQAARAMNNIGYIYFYFYYDYQKAYSYLNQSQKISEDKKFEKNLSYVYLNMANLFLTMSEVQPTEKYFAKKPLQYYRKAFRCALKSKEWNVLQIIYSNMLFTAFSEQNMNEIQEERHLYNHLQMPAHTPLALYNNWMEKAIRSYQGHNYKDVLHFLQKAKQSVDTPDTPERYVYTTIGMEILIYELLNDNKAVKEKFLEMTQLVNQYDIKDLKVEHFRQMLDYYSQKNQHDSINRYEILYFKAKDALVTESRLHAAGEMHFLSELQDANDKVRILAAQHRQQQIIMLLCVILVAVSALSAIYFIRKNRELRRKQQALYEKMQERLHREDESRQVKYLNSKLDEQDKKQIFGMIQAVMSDTALICSPDFSLRLLAEKVDKPYAEVSQVVNEMAGKNFNAFLGECRVKEACRRLSDISQYGHLTIEAISASVGFKSRTNFVAIFKKVTGLTPSEYQRTARLQNAAQNA